MPRPGPEGDAATNGRGRRSTRPDRGGPDDAESSPARLRDTAIPAVAETSGERIEVRIGSIELRGAEPAEGGSRHAAQGAALPSGFDDYATLRSYR